MKSWVSSAFGNIQSTPSSSSVSTRPTSRNVSGRTVENASSQRVGKFPQTNDENINKATVKSKSVLTNNKLKPEPKLAKNEQSLADKYTPTNRSDLVVNKSKVDQLSSSIDEMTSRKRGSILLIDGPTGCGKTVT